MWKVTANSTLAMGFTTLRHMGKPLGATFIGISILVLMIGVNRFVVRRFYHSPLRPPWPRDLWADLMEPYFRYYESQGWLMKGKFPASRGSIFLLTLVACLVRPAYHQCPNY